MGDGALFCKAELTRNQQKAKTKTFRVRSPANRSVYTYLRWGRRNPVAGLEFLAHVGRLRPRTRLHGTCELAGRGGSDEAARKIQKPLARNDPDDSHLSVERFSISPGIDLFARERCGWSHLQSGHRG